MYIPEPATNTPKPRSVSTFGALTVNVKGEKTELPVVYLRTYKPRGKREYARLFKYHVKRKAFEGILDSHTKTFIFEDIENAFEIATAEATRLILRFGFNRNHPENAKLLKLEE